MKIRIRCHWCQEIFEMPEGSSDPKSCPLCGHEFTSTIDAHSSLEDLVKYVLRTGAAMSVTIAPVLGPPVKDKHGDEIESAVVVSFCKPADSIHYLVSIEEGRLRGWGSERVLRDK